DAGNPRIQRNLQHAVSLVAEKIVRFLDVVESEPMGHERSQIDSAALHHRHEASHPLLAAWTERRDDLLIAESGIEGFVRRHQLARVDAEARQGAAGTDCA